MENEIVLSDFQFALNPADGRRTPFCADCTALARCSHHVQYYVPGTKSMPQTIESGCGLMV